MTQPTDREQSARDDLYDALDQSWYRWDPPTMAKGTGIIHLIDAHQAEVRTAVLREAAEAAEGELLQDDTGTPEDEAYNQGVRDAIAAINRRMAEEGKWAAQDVFEERLAAEDTAHGTAEEGR